MITSAERIRTCNHHALMSSHARNTTMKGWSLEVVYTARNVAYWRCRRCAGIFAARFPLEEAIFERAK